MKRRRRWTVHLTVEPERTMLRGWRTLDAAKAVGARPMWLAGSRSWSVAPRFTGDVLAWLEHAGAQVVLAGPDVVTATLGADLPQAFCPIASGEAMPPKLATAVASSPARATCSGEQVMAEDVQRVAHHDQLIQVNELAPEPTPIVQCIGQFEDPMLPFDGAA